MKRPLLIAAVLTLAAALALVGGAVVWVWTGEARGPAFEDDWWADDRG